MYRLLSIEFQKIFKNRASKFLVFAYFVLLSFIAFIVSIEFEIGTFKLRVADQGIFNFPYIWHFNTYIAALFKMFLAIVVVSMMANEYSYGTLKQNLIDGLSKKEFILSKFYTILVFALTSTLFVFLLSLILGYSFSSYTEFAIVFSDLDYLFAFFLKLVAFFSFCLFLGILVKRSAFALGFLFILFVGEFMLTQFLRWNWFPKTDVYKQVSQFFPLMSMSNLIDEPFSRLSAIKNIEATITGESVERLYDVQLAEIAIVLVWILTFIWLSYKLLKNRDL